jgi:glycine cleavage system H protein
VGATAPRSGEQEEASVDVPDDLKYTKEHEWARVEGKRVTVGITDFAQDALGDVVYVDVPEPGTEVRAGEPFGEVESTKSVSDVYAPVTGTVVDRNGALADSPQLVNQDPYRDGWMIVIEVTDPAELEGLMEPGAYRDLTVSESGQE